jgi:hemerythrin-like domain-containing protein
MSSTQNLLDEHLIVRRLGNIAKKCSDGLYSNQNIPIEDIQIISVVIEEFVDAFHHGKEENAYFPVTQYKNSFSEDIRKFLIEHELGRRIAKMLRRELELLIDYDKYDQSQGLKWNDNKSKEPVARFLKSYAVFVFDHTGKEDAFFEKVQEKQSLSEEEDIQLIKHYELCKNRTGGQARIEEMIKLVGYLENRKWMR